MKQIGPAFFTRGTILGHLLGLAAAVTLIALVRNYVIAIIVGALLGVAIAGLRQPRPMSRHTLITGALAGLYLGAIQDPTAAASFFSEAWLARAALMLGQMALFSLICGVYGYLTGIVLALYEKGRGPFF
jgi:hypothetical protein